MRGGSVGRATEAAQQRSGDGGQFCSGFGSARAAEAAQRRRWMRRRQLGGGGQRGGRAASAAAARRWRWHGGRGGGGGSPIAPATALPIPLLIAAARLGNVAVSLCGMRGCGDSKKTRKYVRHINCTTQLIPKRQRKYTTSTYVNCTTQSQQHTKFFKQIVHHNPINIQNHPDKLYDCERIASKLYVTIR